MADYDDIRTLADILPLRARLTPDGTALQELSGAGQLVDTSFAELAARAGRYAGALFRHGVAPRIGRATAFAIIPGRA